MSLRLALLCCLCLTPSPALADAVPPPPSKCPRGQVPITSHAGPECVEPPPKNCPPGWAPQIRGVCYLWTCETDQQCGDGKLCREADLCLEESLQEWGFTAAEPSRNRPLFAGPPVRYDPPRKVITPVDVCSDGRSCPASAKCSKGKLCLPKGVNRPGVWPGGPGSSAKNPKAK